MKIFEKNYYYLLNDFWQIIKSSNTVQVYSHKLCLFWFAETFRYDITPSYGPMAGGTNVVLHGAWLNGTNQVMIGDTVYDICNTSSRM